MEQIKILEAINHFKRLVVITNENISNLPSMGYLPNLIERYKHNIDIYERCISRLTAKYERGLKLLDKSELEQLNASLLKLFNNTVNKDYENYKLNVDVDLLLKSIETFKQEQEQKRSIVL